MSTPRLLVIEHEDDCTVALFGDWITGSGVDLDIVRPWKGDAIPSDVEQDGLLVLGGAMGAHDDEAAPWLPDVRALLAQSLPAGVPTLGICLGAQLMAVAAGGRVEVGDAGPEIGVFPLELTPQAADDALFASLASPVIAGQWHADAITSLPEDSVLLAANDRYDVQAFRLGDAAWGVQFHPEVDHAVMATWAAAEHSESFPPGVLAKAVSEVADAEPVLKQTWRGPAERFAGVVRTRRNLTHSGD